MVQIIVTGYGPALEEGDRYNVSHQRRIGAGVRIDDHERPVNGLPGLAAALYLHPPDEDLKLEVLRGGQRLAVIVPAIRHRDEGYDLADLIDPRNAMEGLGVFMAHLDGGLRAPAEDRRSQGPW